MRSNRLKTGMIVAPALVLAAACGRSEEPRIDDALRNDLALAAQAQAYQPQQFVSPVEQGAAYGTIQPVNAAYAPGPYYAPAPRAAAPRPAARPVYRASSASRGSSGTVYREPARQPSQPMVRHKARDAAIGAAAGAIIGATTSRDRVKGGIIGGVAGGVLGGIIGHTVDVQK